MDEALQSSGKQPPIVLKTPRRGYNRVSYPMNGVWRQALVSNPLSDECIVPADGRLESPITRRGNRRWMVNTARRRILSTTTK